MRRSIMPCVTAALLLASVACGPADEGPTFGASGGKGEQAETATECASSSDEELCTSMCAGAKRLCLAIATIGFPSQHPDKLDLDVECEFARQWCSLAAGKPLIWCQSATAKGTCLSTCEDAERICIRHSGETCALARESCRAAGG